MRFWHDTLRYDTRGHGQVLDLTGALENLVGRWGVARGQGVVFVPGSTAAVTTIEYEPGVVEDLAEALAKLAPEGVPYRHDAAWGDGNGYAHVRAALVGPSLAFLVRDGRLVRGTWQQIVLCDFDNRARRRTVEIQIVGEPGDRG
ncbi:MAG: secondary thiamine-phosphate synthase enzyme YjbQ [Deferrisomatales bacterium]